MSGTGTGIEKPATFTNAYGKVAALPSALKERLSTLDA